MSKRQRFMVILAIIAVLGIAFSLITRVTFVTQDTKRAFRVVVFAPLSGADAVKGKAVQQGAQLYVNQLNQAGGIDKRAVELVVLDDKNDPAVVRSSAQEVMGRSDILAVVGGVSPATAQAAADVYGNAGIPVISPQSLLAPTGEASPWLFSTLFDRVQQSRFLANYVLNVTGRKLTTIVADTNGYNDTMAVPYEETYKRFGTAIRYKWSFDGRAGNTTGVLGSIVAELKDKNDAGAVFLAMGPEHAAKMVRLMHDAGLRNVIVGPTAMASTAFRDYLVGEIQGRDPAPYLDKLLVTSPLVFDTANEAAQNFLNAYRTAYGDTADWMAAHSYDATAMVFDAIKTLAADKPGDDLHMWRDGIRAKLAGHATVDTAYQGVTGGIYFNAKGLGGTPVLIGIYNGSSIISALTQLQPITKGGAMNYIAELKQGRMLYVNDRFMYKTNVVYTGIQLHEIVAIDEEKNSATLDLSLWFRYRGEFDPQTLTILNALEPVALDKPQEESTSGDMTYRRYRITGDFSLNFSDTARFYGSHVLGLSFTHQQLNRNNLLFVADVLGLGLDSGGNLLDKIKNAHVLNPNMGWLLDRAWISQDIMVKNSLGDPTYVGYSAATPEFSRIDFGVLVKPDQISARDVIPAEYFLYLGIFGLLGSLFAVWMDRKEKGRFWYAQSWGLRLVSWPLLLLAAGNIGLDLAFRNLSPTYIDILLQGYKSAWWIIAARLGGIALERFLWVPLEDHTERNIPNVVRVFASLTLYSLALFGIIAFVYGQAITSLLATSGLLAMIIGLAVQANISNVFSGIVLNVERPFKVGDWVQIGDQDEGVVIDITWRTTRVKTRNGYVISLPNGQVSEATVHNFDSFDTVRLEIPLYLSASYDPEDTAEIMEQGLAKAPNIVEFPEREVRFKGIKWELGWIATYEIQFWIENYGGREEIAEQAVICVWDELRANGVDPDHDSKAARSHGHAVEAEA